MKIQINKPEDISPKGFQEGQLLEGFKGGIYLATTSQEEGDCSISVVVIKGEDSYEYTGKVMENCPVPLFKLFTGSVTLSND